MDAQLKRIIRMEAVVVVVFVLGLLFFIFYPRLEMIVRLRREVRLASEANKNLPQDAIEKYEKEFRKKMLVSKKRLEYVQKIVQKIKAPNKQASNIPLVTLVIEDLVKKSGIELKSIKPLPMDSHSEEPIVPIEIVFSDTYAHFLDFLDQLKSSSYFLTIRQATVKESRSMYPELDFHIVLDALLSQAGRSQ